MTKLDGVNDMLRAVGRSAVSGLDTGRASPASEAERVLDRHVIDVQAMGWHYNRRDNIELEPNGDGNVAVPTGVIGIDADREHGETRNITVVGDGLYDLGDNTDEFDSDVTVKYTLAYEFKCIPLMVQKYIVACAAAEFNATNFGDVNRQPRLEHMKIQAWAMAVRDDEDKSDANILNTQETLRVRGMRIPVGGISYVSVNGNPV